MHLRAKSKVKMPYGAIRIKLNSPPKGQFYNFLITKDNLQIMQPDSQPPAVINLKARLSLKDTVETRGYQLSGQLENVNIGTKNLSITINETHSPS